MCSPWCEVFGREKGRETSLEHVGAAADCVGRVTVVGALAVETEVAGRRNEERLEEVSLHKTVDLAETARE